MNDPNVLLQLGTGGLFALLLLQAVFSFLKDKKRNGNGNEHVTNKKLDEVMVALKEVKQQSLEAAIDGLRESVEAQTEMFSQFALVQERMLSFLERLEGSAGRRRTDSASGE